MVWPVALGADAEPPWLNVDAAIPEAGLGCGDLDRDRAAQEIEAHIFIAGGRVRHIDWFSIDFDCEGGGPHFFGDRRGKEARCSRHGNRQNQGETKQSVHAEQAAELPRIKWGLSNVAPMR